MQKEPDLNGKNTSSEYSDRPLVCQQIFTFNLYKYTCLSKVKLVYNEHPWEPKLVDVGDRWSLFRGH